MRGRAVVAILWLGVLPIAAAAGRGAWASPDREPVAPTSAVFPPPPALIGAARSSCPVTRPNLTRGVPVDADAGWYGNEVLATNLWMWDDWAGGSRVPVPASHVQPDGSFGPLKWAWYRYARGRLTIEGRRLDAPAPPLRAEIPEGFGDGGFQPVGLIFPTEGCWEVTGRIGDASLTFVTLVIPPR